MDISSYKLTQIRRNDLLNVIILRKFISNYGYKADYVSVLGRGKISSIIQYYNLFLFVQYITLHHMSLDDHLIASQYAIK